MKKDSTEEPSTPQPSPDPPSWFKRLPKDPKLIIWSNVLKDKGFYATMILFKIRDQPLLHDLSSFLSVNNEIWKRWFFEDFRDFAIDLGYMDKKRSKINDLGVPRWILESKFNWDSMHPPLVEDGLFTRVPWRRFYMWCRFMRRFSAKYAVGMYLHMEYLVQYMKHQRDSRDPELMEMLGEEEEEEKQYLDFVDVLTEEEQQKSLRELLQYVRDDTIDKLRRTQVGGLHDENVYVPRSVQDSTLQSKFLRSMAYSAISYSELVEENQDGSIQESKSSVFSLWIMYKKYKMFMSVHEDPDDKDIFLGRRDRSFQLRVGDGKELIEREHQYNFNNPGKAVKTFMYWYMTRMAEVGHFRRFERKETDEYAYLHPSIFVASYLLFDGSRLLEYFEDWLNNEEESGLKLVEVLQDKSKDSSDDTEGKTSPMDTSEEEEVLETWPLLENLPYVPRIIKKATGKPDQYFAFLGNSLIGKRHHGGGGSGGSHGTSKAKWLKMAHESTIKGHPITAKQRRYFFYKAGKNHQHQ